MIPDIELQAAAGEEWAEELGIRRVYPTGDGGVLGEALLAPAVVDEPVYVTSSAQAPQQLPQQGQDFARAYEAEYGQPPDRYAAYGYEAMAVVLDSIDRATDPSDREAVIDAFFATEGRDSVLGTYSIDEIGNTTLNAISGYVVENGRPVFEAALEAP